MAPTIAIIGFALVPKMRPCFPHGAGMAYDTSGLNPCQPESQVRHAVTLFGSCDTIEIYCMWVKIFHLEEGISSDIDFYHKLKTVDC